MVWSYILLGIFVVILLSIGIVGMKKSQSLDGFLFGGKSVGPWISAFSYGTAYFSAVLFIGYAGKSGWVYGLSSVWIGIGNALIGCLTAWLLFAKKTRLATQKMDAKTMPDYFAKRYDSEKMKIVSAVIIFIFLIPYTASVYVGLGFLFETVLHIPYVYCMMFMAIMTALYLSMGGYFTSSITDFVQGIIMIAGVILMVFFVVHSEPVGGLRTGAQRLAEIDSQLVSAFGGEGWYGLFCLMFLSSVGALALPQMVHKFYAIRDEKAIRSATVISTIFSLIIGAGAYFTGSFGRLFFEQVPNNNYDNIMPLLLQSALPEFVLALILLLVLSASMSTLSSLVLSSSSTVTIDLIQGRLKKNMRQRNVVITMRILCVVFVALSFVVAYFPNPILMLMSFSWGAIAGAFLGPYACGILYKGTTKAGAWTGMLGGLGIALVLMIGSGFNAARSPEFGMYAMVGSVVLTLVVSLFTKKFDETHIKNVMPYGVREAKEK